MDEERFKRGLEIRRQVLGEERVARSLDGATPFSKPLQELVTEYAWGAGWGGEALERRVRSLVNLGMLTALNRSHELELHVRGAVANGCSSDEIQEVLLQAAIYCGIPAGMEAFRVAESVLIDLDVEAPARADGASDG